MWLASVWPPPRSTTTLSTPPSNCSTIARPDCAIGNGAGCDFCRRKASRTLPARPRSIRSPSPTTARRFVSGSWDGKARVWDSRPAKSLLTIPYGALYVHAVAFSPDGELIATGGSDKQGYVKIWNAKTGALVRTLVGHTRRRPVGRLLPRRPASADLFLRQNGPAVGRRDRRRNCIAIWGTTGGFGRPRFRPTNRKSSPPARMARPSSGRPTRPRRARRSPATRARSTPPRFRPTGNRSSPAATTTAC